MFIGDILYMMLKIWLQIILVVIQRWSLMIMQTAKTIMMVTQTREEVGDYWGTI